MQRIATGGGAARWAPAALILLLGTLVVLRAAFGATGHDEDQYLAGAAAAGDGLIFRDFLHLQTPIQAWLFQPLVEAFQPNAFFALRVVTGLIGAATLAMIYAAAREQGCTRIAAGAATFLVWATEIFHYASGFLRNDILPAFFLTLALWAAARALRHKRPRLWAACGLALALAACTKVSFALPAAAVAVYLLARAAKDRSRLPDLLALAAGGAVAGASTLVAFAAAPENFLYGTLFYHAAAPFDWYAANGLQARLSLGGKSSDVLGYLAAGPALAMLAVVAASRFVGAPDPAAKEARRFFDLVLAACAVAAWMPTPAWPFYLVILLPPLAVQFGAGLDRLALGGASPLVRRSTFACLLLTVPLGWSQSIGAGATALRNQNPVRAMAGEARWLGRQLAACGARGRVASFTARWVVDSGYELDPRFAPGVFVFRSGGLLSSEEAGRLNVATPRTLARQLDAVPPAAIATGNQKGTELFPLQPDRPLLAYASSRGWTRLDHPGGAMTVFVNPERQGRACGRVA